MSKPTGCAPVGNVLKNLRFKRSESVAQEGMRTMMEARPPSLKSSIFLVAPFVLLLASCGAAVGVVGTYECPHGSQVRQLELTSKGEAIWTMPSQHTATQRYEEKDGEVKIYPVAATPAGEMDELAKWRQEAAMNNPSRRFILESGNLRDVVNEGESCARK